MSQKIVKSKEYLSTSEDTDSDSSDDAPKRSKQKSNTREKLAKISIKEKNSKEEKPARKRNLLTSESGTSNSDDDKPTVSKKKEKRKKPLKNDSDSDSADDSDDGHQSKTKKPTQGSSDDTDSEPIKIKKDKHKKAKESSQKSQSSKPKKSEKDKSKTEKHSQPKEVTKPKAKKPKIDKESYQVLLGATGKKYARYNVFKGTSYIDIREMYEKEGKLLPGAKGISLKQQIAELLFEQDLKDKVKDNLDALKGGAKETPKFSIGGSKIYISVRMFKKFTLIDLREFYTDKSSGEDKPGKKGISLNPGQWYALQDEKENILALFS